MQDHLPDGPEHPEAPTTAWSRAWPEATWHNLFYDLAFVAAILVLAGSYSIDYTLLNGMWVAFTFTMLWCTWLVTSLAVARMPVGPTRVTLVAVQMGFVLAAAVAAGGAVAQTADQVELIFAGMLLSVAALVWLALPPGDSLRRGVSTVQLAAAAAALGVSPLMPVWYYLVAWLLAVALVAQVGLRFVRAGTDSAHTYTHRFGELTMIVLGESFVKVGLSDDSDGLSAFRISALVLIIVIITTTWWGYFGVIARGDAGGSGRRRVAWAALHVPLHVGLVFLAVGLAKLLSDSKSLLHGGVGGLLIAHLVLIMVALAGLSLVSGGHAARPVAGGLAGAAVIAAVVALLTPHLGWLTPTAATWCATVPFVLAIAGLHHRQVVLFRRTSPHP